MKVARTARFKKAWEQLTETDKRLARKAIARLVKDLRYPAIRTKKIKGVNNIWEARASLSLRITFQIEKDVIILRNIGHHDETLKLP
jgi:mRNA interferase RelE/StbE